MGFLGCHSADAKAAENTIATMTIKIPIFFIAFPPFLFVMLLIKKLLCHFFVRRVFAFHFSPFLSAGI
jgi:hypothetical protein